MKYRTISGNGKTIHILICERCGKDLKQVKNIFTTKYCDECRPIINREKAAARMRKMRSKAKERGTEVEPSSNA